MKKHFTSRQNRVSRQSDINRSAELRNHNWPSEKNFDCAVSEENLQGCGQIGIPE